MRKLCGRARWPAKIPRSQKSGPVSLSKNCREPAILKNRAFSRLIFYNQLPAKPAVFKKMQNSRLTLALTQAPPAR